MRGFGSACVALLAVGLVGTGAPRPASAAESIGDYVKDERWGFKVRTPKEWTQAAMSASEQWIAAKHIAPRALAPKKVAGYLERPEMWVIAFPKERQKTGKVEEGKNEAGGETITITIRNPYKDYKAFVKEMGLAGGGYHFSKEDPGEVDGKPVTMYEIIVDKLVDAPLRILAWQYQFPDVDFVVQLRVLEDYYEDYARTFDAVLKSFRAIPRTQPFPEAAKEGQKVTFEDESKLTPEQRAKRRQQKFEDTLQKEIAGLPQGWITVRSDHYVALSHVDPKFTQQTLDFAEAIRGYLDRTFTIGNEYVPPGIIRIFANQGEEAAFQQGSGSGILAWLAGSPEQVLVTKRQGEGVGYEYEYLAHRVTSQWLAFRNVNLSRSMPFWIHEGLRRHMGFARPGAGKRVDFKPDPYDKETLREMFRKGTAIPLKDLLLGDEEKFKEHGHVLEAGQAVSWLLGEGGKGKLKGSVQTYLKELTTAVNEAEAEAKAKRDASKGSSEEPSRPRTEEEEEAEMKALSTAIEAKRAALRERAFKAAFGAMDDGDWKRLDAAFQKFAN